MFELRVTPFFRRSLFATSLLSVCWLAGCPAAMTGPPQIAGTWSGSLTCDRTQSVGSMTAAPQTSMINYSITFDDDGIPTSVLILGFSDAPDQETGITRVGETDTQTAAAGVLTVTQDLSVTSASFADNSVQVGIRIDYSATGGALTQTGGGTQTFSATVDGDMLSVNFSVDYDVTQSTGPINLDTGELIECTGTLQRQP